MELCLSPDTATRHHKCLMGTRFGECATNAHPIPGSYRVDGLPHRCASRPRTAALPNRVAILSRRAASGSPPVFWCKVRHTGVVEAHTSTQMDLPALWEVSGRAPAAVAAVWVLNLGGQGCEAG